MKTLRRTSTTSEVFSLGEKVAAGRRRVLRRAAILRGQCGGRSRRSGHRVDLATGSLGLALFHQRERGWRQTHSQTGATLTEVLMSLLIMSIGVVSVATLFPISTLRTLEANKQTNSTIARFNAEALVDVDPQFVHNPDGVWPPGGPDNTPYNGNTFRGLNYVVDPIGWQNFNEDPAPPTPGAPLSAATIISPPPTGNSPRDWFGNSLPTFPAIVAFAPLPRRYTGASLFPVPYASDPVQLTAAKARAAELATQPDNWKLIVEAQAVATTSATPPATGIISVTLDNDADLSSINVVPGVTYRAVIFDIDGSHSETRLLSANPVGQQISWLDPLPARFNVSPSTGATPNVGKVRIEVADLIYSWMLSVRKRSSGAANVDVVVFFGKRSTDWNHERVFDAEFRMWDLGPGPNAVPGGPGDDNGNGTPNDVGEVGYPGSDDTRNGVVTIKVPSSATDDERPKLRRGGYIYDTKNGLWYRIRAMQNQQYGVGPGGNEDWVDVVLDETIRADSTEDLDGDGSLNLPGEDRNGNGKIDRGGAIVHPQVVNVFPLEIKEP